VTPLHANAPVVLPPDYDRVLAALERHAKDAADKRALSG
jgi:threonine synthase